MGVSSIFRFRSQSNRIYLQQYFYLEKMNISLGSSQPYYIARNYRVPATLIRNLDMQLSTKKSVHQKQSMNRSNKTTNTVVYSPQNHYLQAYYSLTPNQSVRNCIQRKTTNAQLLKQKLAQIISKRDQCIETQKQESLCRNNRKRTMHKLLLQKKIQQIKEQKKHIYQKYKHICNRQRNQCHICQKYAKDIANLSDQLQQLGLQDSTVFKSFRKKYLNAFNATLPSQLQKLEIDKTDPKQYQELQLDFTYRNQKKYYLNDGKIPQNNTQRLTNHKLKSRINLRSRSFQNKQLNSNAAEESRLGNKSSQMHLNNIRNRFNSKEFNKKIKDKSKTSAYKKQKCNVTKKNAKIKTVEKRAFKENILDDLNSSKSEVLNGNYQISKQKLKLSKKGSQLKKIKIKKFVNFKTDGNQVKQKANLTSRKKVQIKNKQAKLIESFKQIKSIKALKFSPQQSLETSIPSIGKILMKKALSKNQYVSRKQDYTRNLKAKAIIKTKLFVKQQSLSLLQIQSNSQGESLQFCIYKNPIDNHYDNMTRYEQQKFMFGLMQESLLTKSRNRKNKSQSNQNKQKVSNLIANASTFRQFIEKVVHINAKQATEQQQARISLFKDIFTIEIKKIGKLGITGIQEIKKIPLNQIKAQITKRLTKNSKIFERFVQIHAFYLYLQKNLKDKLKLLQQPQFSNCKQNQQIMDLLGLIEIPREMVKYEECRWQQETVDRSYAFQSYRIQNQEENINFWSLNRIIQQQLEPFEMVTVLGQKGFYQEDSYEVQEPYPYAFQ